MGSTSNLKAVESDQQVVHAGINSVNCRLQVSKLHLDLANVDCVRGVDAVSNVNNAALGARGTDGYAVVHQFSAGTQCDTTSLGCPVPESRWPPV